MSAIINEIIKEKHEKKQDIIVIILSIYYRIFQITLYKIKLVIINKKFYFLNI